MHDESTRKGQLVAITDGTLTEQDARAMLERIRWPNGLVCAFPDCGGSEVYRIEAKAKVLKSGKKQGPRHLFKCKACRRQFSVTKGTIFEDSKIPLRTWILVMYRMGSSKKGLSAHQVHREFGLSYESAWFMCHRIRFAMRNQDTTPLRGIIEADETYVGGKPRGHRAHRAAKYEKLRKLSGAAEIEARRQW
jgi:transposase-like protein